MEVWKEVAVSFTGVSSLDHSIDKVNAWLAEIADEFGTDDRHFAYRVTRAWLHALRDRLPVPIAAHFAAQLPDLLRGVFYEGWNPSKVPVRYGRDGYVTRFARESGIREQDVPRAASLMTRMVRRHVSGGLLDEALEVLPAELRRLVEPMDAELLARGER
jgi:uncharacterized protein (DUF2267 family)